MIGAPRYRAAPPPADPNRKATMRYVNLGATGLRVSRVCLGMMGFGNDSVPYPALGHA